MTAVSDIEIVHSIRKGNQISLESIYVKNYPMVRDYILKNSGSEVDAKDIYQDGMIILHEKLMDPSFLLTAQISCLYRFDLKVTLFSNINNSVR